MARGGGYRYPYGYRPGQGAGGYVAGLAIFAAVKHILVPLFLAVARWATARRLLYMAAGTLLGLILAQFLMPLRIDPQFLPAPGEGRGRVAAVWACGGLLIVIHLQAFGMWWVSHRNAVAEQTDGPGEPGAEPTWFTRSFDGGPTGEGPGPGARTLTTRLMRLLCWVSAISFFGAATTLAAAPWLFPSPPGPSLAESLHTPEGEAGIAHVLGEPVAGHVAVAGVCALVLWVVTSAAAHTLAERMPSGRRRAW